LGILLYTFHLSHRLIAYQTRSSDFGLHADSLFILFAEYAWQTIVYNSRSLSTMPNKKSKRNGKAASKSGSVADKSADLWFACRTKNVVKARAAIAAGADVNYVCDEITCLMEAVRYDVSCLTVAASEGCYKIAELLLAAGADKEASDQQGVTALMLAAASGHHNFIELLLTAGADKEAKCVDGDTALIAAAAMDRVKCLDVLLKAGADKEAKTMQGNTALIKASEEGHDQCVALLLTAGADKNAMTAQGTALIAAAANGHDKSLKLLLTVGADTEAKGKNCYTALITAAATGHAKCVHLLVSAGCDINARDNEGASTLENAIIKNRIDCVRTLVRAGADASIQLFGRSLDDLVDVAVLIIDDKDAMKAALRLTTSAVAARCEECALCATALSTTKRLRCDCCLAVCYCSQACQRSDWKGNHKQTCKAPSVVVATAPPAVAEKQYCCAQCGTTTSDRKKMQTCSVCKTVYYCNRKCQVAHWELHEPVCKVKPVE
jgi:ankyrin repeat protein